MFLVCLLTGCQAYTLAVIQTPWLRAPAARGPAMRLQEHDVSSLGDQEPRVDLVEETSGRSLPCFLAATLEYEGSTYAALYPVDAPVSLAEMVGERLMPIDDERESAAMISAATKACAANDIQLTETPVVLTASGTGLDYIEGESEPVEYADDDEDDEGEEALILAKFDDEGAEVLVVQTLDPLYVVGKQLEADGKRFTVPSDSEIEAISDTIEQLVIDFEEAIDFEEDSDDDLEELDGNTGGFSP